MEYWVKMNASPGSFTDSIKNSRENYYNMIKELSTIFDIKESVTKENIRFVFFNKRI